MRRRSPRRTRSSLDGRFLFCCKGNLRRRLRMRAGAEAGRRFRREHWRSCEGGSKENRNGDPLRRAKVYIQRTHMEERACKGLWRPVLIGYRVYGADANGGRVGCRYRQGRRGDSVIASGGSEYRQERKRKAGGSGERSGSERKGAWERAEGRENGRKRERPLTGGRNGRSRHFAHGGRRLVLAITSVWGTSRRSGAR